ncbi:MAG: InlB B-repeat-containing protein, partial [Bacilli bacterium]
MKKIVYLLFFLVILSSCTIDIVGEKFTVTFDSRGGSSINDVIVDQEVVVFDNPTKEGNTFLGWYKDINDETSKIVDSK